MPLDPFLGQSQDHGGPQMPQLKAEQRLFNRRYELRQLLGAGGMGVVWLAHDHTEEIDVALKFLPSVLVVQEGEMKRLREEVRAGKELRHPRLVATYGMEIEDGIAAIVMEFVPGQTLRQKLDDHENGFFEPEEITGWVKDMTDGLGYLHEEAKRIHRDLKPANVMIDAAGRAKLMDFGISHRIKEGVSKHSKTNEGAASSSSSTLAYASPQQLSGRPSNKADDIYSLGATLYELLTGTPPFFRGDALTVAIQIKTERVTPIMVRRQELVDEGLNRETGQKVREDIEQAVMACLTKDRENRLTDAAAVWRSFSQPAKPAATDAQKAAQAQRRAALQQQEEERKRAELEQRARQEAEAQQRLAFAQQPLERKRTQPERGTKHGEEQKRGTAPQPPSRPPPPALDRTRFLWASFVAILAGGVGFAIRGGIFDNWAKEFGFTGAQLGAIGGMGFYGFCFGIILGGVVVDKIGYGKLVVVAFLLHIVSALITFTASGSSAFMVLSLGMFIFAFANGTLEAVANPLVATLFPENRTHHLNILHASWPAGMVIGVIIGWYLDDKLEINWRIQLALYLIPTVIYGLMFMGRKFPKSEAAATGASFVRMIKPIGIPGALLTCCLLVLFFKDFSKTLGSDEVAAVGYSVCGFLLIAVAIITQFSFGSFLLFALFITHALVGAMELSTDGWIQNITRTLLTPNQLKWVFLWSSAILFGLRFCAHFIQTRFKLSPIGLLLICAVIACIGLNLVSTMQTFTMALVVMGVYAIGKALLWPTMLAVIGDRFPQTGALAMSVMGAIGMLSAGLIGGPGLGYCKDRFAGEELKKVDAALYQEYRAGSPSTFLDIPATAVYGLDGQKVSEARTASEKTPAQQTVLAADQQSDRTTIKADSWIPAIMAVTYLVLLLFFKFIGGYRAIRIDEAPA